MLEQLTGGRLTVFLPLMFMMACNASAPEKVAQDDSCTEGRVFAELVDSGHLKASAEERWRTDGLNCLTRDGWRIQLSRVVHGHPVFDSSIVFTRRPASGDIVVIGDPVEYFRPAIAEPSIDESTVRTVALSALPDSSIADIILGYDDFDSRQLDLVYRVVVMSRAQRYQVTIDAVDGTVLETINTSRQ